MPALRATGPGLGHKPPLTSLQARRPEKPPSRQGKAWRPGLHIDGVAKGGLAWLLRNTDKDVALPNSNTLFSLAIESMQEKAMLMGVYYGGRYITTNCE